MSWILKIIAFLPNLDQTTNGTIKQLWAPKTLKIIINYDHYKNMINHSENDDENEK